MRTSANTPLFVLLLLAGVLFLVNLGGYDLWPPDEPRFAQVAREMMASGDYLVPRINGRVYQEKPPLMFWITALVSTPFGDVTEWSARLPSVFAALVTLVFTYLLSVRMFGRRVAFWAGLILITTHRFWWQARVGQLDMLLTACMTMALYFLWRWHQERRTGHLVAVYAAMAAGLLVKGPPALVFPLLSIYAFYWGRKEDRKAIHPVLGSLAACGIALVWFVPARLGISVETAASFSEGISSNLFRQTIGRFFLGVNHAHGPWYYLLQLPLDLLPWALFLPWVLPWIWRRRKESEEMRFLWSWTFPAFIFFSICIGKRAIYLLPLHPAIAMLFAVALLGLAEAGGRKAFRMPGAAWGATLILLSLAPVVLGYSPYAGLWTPWLLVVSAAAMVSGCTVLWWTWRKPVHQAPAAIGGSFSVLAICVALIVLPTVNHHKSAKDFCAPLREMTHAGHNFDLYSLMFSREEYVFYAGRFHQPVPEYLDENSSGLMTQSVEKAREIQQLLRQLQRATEAVPLDTVLAPSAGEQQALEAAVEDTARHILAQDAPVYTQLARMFSDFFATLQAPAPGFVIVQERDWRWIRALFKEKAAQLHVLHHERVGGRQVLLLANGPGETLLEQHRVQAETKPVSQDTRLVRATEEEQ